MQSAAATERFAFPLHDAGADFSDFHSWASGGVGL
jgi:hypothetical protein